jgi:uncharacterized damage-inducible protein DinB
LIEGLFLKFSVEKLTQLSGRIEDCLGRLTDDQIWLRSHESQNSVGNLVLHLCGNVTQWILCGVGGQIDHRDRDSEFNARGGVSGADLAARLKQIIAEATDVIRELTPEQLVQPKSIQKYEVTAMEGVYHVVEHFAQHTAQIIFATKLLTGQDLGYYKHLNKPKHLETTP